jgi:hypothetical protein
VASTQPSLIDLGDGSRVELTKAEAAFDKDGETLVINADQGLLRFNFAEGNDVRIETSKYQFTADKASGSLGEIGLNRKGQVIMEVAQGSFSMLNKSTGAVSRIAAGQPMLLLAQSGKGLITRSGSSITDSAKIFQPNELKGLCAVSGNEAYAILGNTTSIISVRGSWGLESGDHPYEVVKCTEAALMSAGASSGAAAAAVKSAASVGGSSFPKTAVALAGAGAGAGVALGIYYATKSESSRTE